LFFIVEKIVRFVEDNAQNGAHSLGHGHHHHHHKQQDTSDKTNLDHKKTDHEAKDTDQADKETLHDGVIGKVDDADHKESNATIRKVYLKL
jgi:zinc transporter 7